MSAALIPAQYVPVARTDADWAFDIVLEGEDWTGRAIKVAFARIGIPRERFEVEVGTGIEEPTEGLSIALRIGAAFWADKPPGTYSVEARGFDGGAIDDAAVFQMRLVRGVSHYDDAPYAVDAPVGDGAAIGGVIVSRTAAVSVVRSGGVAGPPGPNAANLIEFDDTEAQLGASTVEAAIIALQQKILTPRPKTIVVLGSSNGAGLGASTYVSDPSLANGWASPSTSWAGRLIAALQGFSSDWRLYNRSMSGTGTANAIARFWTDVAVHKPSFVILCTHPQNDSYDTATILKNTTELVRLCRSIGAIPILRGTYMGSAQTAAQYQAMLGLNRALDRLGCHRIDHFSALDDGVGGYVGGTTYQIGDGLHPTDAGYAVFFTAIDLGIFLSGGAGQTEAVWTGAWKPNVASGAGLMVRPATGLGTNVRSFTMRARIKGQAAGASAKAFMTAYYQGDIGVASPLRLRNAAGTYDIGDNVTTFTPSSAINPTTDAGVHDLVVTYNHATNTVTAYVDGAAFATGAGVGVDATGVKAFTFGGRGETANGTVAQGYGFSDIAIWQVPLSARAIAEMYRTNRKPRASLIFEGDLGGTPSATASQGIVANSIPNGLYAEVRDATWATMVSF